MENKHIRLADKEKVRLFALNSNRPLAEKIAHHLDIDLSPVEINSFSDGEIAINIEESVRGCHVYLLQSTNYPTSDYYMEIFIMADALRRASAASINVVMPYYGYARSDRKAKTREPINAKVVANLMERCGVDHIITLDLHSPQIQGFFEIPNDMFTAQSVLTHYFEETYLKGLDNPIVVAPNHSAASIGRQYADLMNLPIAIINCHQSKDGDEILTPIGNVENRQCIIADDLCDTGTTISNVANTLIHFGAEEVYALVTHPVLSEGAVEKLAQSALKKFITTDSILLREDQKNPLIEQLSVAHLLADAIQRVHEHKTTQPLYKSEYTDLFDIEMLED